MLSNPILVAATLSSALALPVIKSRQNPIGSGICATAMADYTCSPSNHQEKRCTGTDYDYCICAGNSFGNGVGFWENSAWGPGDDVCVGQDDGYIFDYGTDISNSSDNSSVGNPSEQDPSQQDGYDGDDSTSNSVVNNGASGSTSTDDDDSKSNSEDGTSNDAPITGESADLSDSPISSDDAGSNSTSIAGNPSSANSISTPLDDSSSSDPETPSLPDSESDDSSSEPTDEFNNSDDDNYDGGNDFDDSTPSSTTSTALPVASIAPSLLAVGSGICQSAMQGFSCTTSNHQQKRCAGTDYDYCICAGDALGNGQGFWENSAWGPGNDLCVGQEVGYIFE